MDNEQITAVTGADNADTAAEPTAEDRYNPDLSADKVQFTAENKAADTDNADTAAEPTAKDRDNSALPAEPVRFTVEYESTDADNADKKMEPTVVTLGEHTPLSTNIYKRKGFRFIGWKSYRVSDGKTCYTNVKGKRLYYTENDQPKGFEPFIYRNNQKVAALSRVDNDRIIMYPQWERNKTSDENRTILEDRLKSRPIVLFGSFMRCRAFYEKYSQILNIRCILLDDFKGAKRGAGKELDGIPVMAFSQKLLRKNDYVVICCTIYSRYDDIYRKAKETVNRAGLSIMQDYIRHDMAKLVLDRKKLCLWLGFCQLSELSKIFNKLEDIKNEWVFTSFRYGFHTLSGQHKYDDFKELLKLCDCLAYIPLFSDLNKIDFDLEDYLAPNAMKVTLPRMPFGAFYPWQKTDDEHTFRYSLDGKNHWPFAYQVGILDDLILKGLSDDEIYNELMREDLFSEAEIKKKLKYSFKLIEISENTSDIKMLDYIKENYTKRLLYRDGFHYTNCVYYELARRVAKFMNWNCENEIDELEVTSEKQYIDFTEIIIIPCVAKALNLDFATDETLYRVRFSPSSAKSIIKMMDRKEWIYTYIKYFKALKALTELWLLTEE